MTLPKGWAQAKLGDFTLERVEQGEPGASAVPYIDIGSIDRDLKRVGPTEKVTRENAPTRARQWVQSNDVLVSLTRPNLNAVAFITPDLDGAVASTGFDVLRPNGVLSEWVFNRVRSQAFVSDVCAGVQGVVYPAIRPADVRRHELPIPPAREQQRIIDAIDSYLTRLDDAVASLEKVKAKLKAYRASVLKAAVEGRLVPTEASIARAEQRAYEPPEALLARILKERRRRWEEAQVAKLEAAGKTQKDDKWKAKYAEPEAPDTSRLSELPTGWSWLTVDALAFVTKLAGFEYTKSVEYDDRGDLSVIKAENAGRDGFKQTDFSRVRSETVAHLTRSRLEVGDLLMVFVGAGTGNVARVPADRRYFLGPNIAMIRVITHALRPAYLEYYLRSPLGNRLALGFSKAVAQESLSMGTIRKIPVALPPLTEQDRIIAALDYQLSVNVTVTRYAGIESARLGRLRQSILKSAFEGKLVDQDPTDEPAKELLARIRTERASPVRAKKNGVRKTKGAA